MNTGCFLSCHPTVLMAKAVYHKVKIVRIGRGKHTKITGRRTSKVSRLIPRLVNRKGKNAERP